MEKVYYRPSYYFDDGTNIGWGGAPEELDDNEVFESENSCLEWLVDNGYDPRDFAINKVDAYDFDEEIVVL